MKNICVFCGGEIQEKIVTVVKECQGEVLIIESVPAGVCIQCGEKEYSAEVAAKLEKILKEQKGIEKKVLVPVANFTVV